MIWGIIEIENGIIRQGRSAPADNILRDVHNSPDHTNAESNDRFIFYSKWLLV